MTKKSFLQEKVQDFFGVIIATYMHIYILKQKYTCYGNVCFLQKSQALFLWFTFLLPIHYIRFRYIICISYPPGRCGFGVLSGEMWQWWWWCMVLICILRRAEKIVFFSFCSCTSESYPKTKPNHKQVKNFIRTYQAGWFCGRPFPADSRHNTFLHSSRKEQVTTTNSRGGATGELWRNVLTLFSVPEKKSK